MSIHKSIGRLHFTAYRQSTVFTILPSVRISWHSKMLQFWVEWTLFAAGVRWRGYEV